MREEADGKAAEQLAAIESLDCGTESDDRARHLRRRRRTTLIKRR